MGKGKKKIVVGEKLDGSNDKQSKAAENSPKAYDKDTAMFVLMAQDLKDEGNRLFQTRDYEVAMLKYEKAINLLPRNHADVSYIRSNMAACYMQMGLSEYPRAIRECNLALEVTPKYNKALLKRARCYEALNRFDLALRDVRTILQIEPNNFMASEIEDRLKITIEEQEITGDLKPVCLFPIPEYMEPSSSSWPTKAVKEKPRKKKKKRIEKGNKGYKFEKNMAEDKVDEKNAEDKLVVEEIMSNTKEEEFKRTIKLVFGQDIRWAQIPVGCSIFEVRNIAQDRFPSAQAFLMKYRDEESDLVTITTSDELRLAELSAGKHGSVKLFIIEVSPEQDPLFEKIKREGEVHQSNIEQNGVAENGEVIRGKEITRRHSCIDDWIIEFAYLFKNHVGFNSDAYLDLHELGMKLYSEAMEDIVTCEEAQDLFHAAADKFQEMAVLALFIWGNVHVSRARKRVYSTEDDSRNAVLAQVAAEFDWANKEYSEAGKRYEEALKIKSDFYECVLALGQQQFELAKLSWYHAISQDVDLETWDPADVLQLYNNAEDNMERGMQMWERAEKQRLDEITTPNKISFMMQKMGLDGFDDTDITSDEAEEQAKIMSTQIHVLWGTLLYERSLMEFKLGIPVWHECLEVAIEKFEIAGASPTDIVVMIQNHLSNETAMEGLGFNINEIVQAWSETHEAKRWHSGIPCFRLEPLLLRRRASYI